MRSIGFFALMLMAFGAAEFGSAASAQEPDHFRGGLL